LNAGKKVMIVHSFNKTIAPVPAKMKNNQTVYYAQGGNNSILSKILACS
jgi:hypothetical protein